jgi:hypothetical protein
MAEWLIVHLSSFHAGVMRALALRDDGAPSG